MSLSDIQEQYARALSAFGGRVHAVGSEQWNEPTPDTEWDVRTLVNHVAVEQLWAPELLSGATMDEVGGRFDGDQLGEEPTRTWDTAADAAQQAAADPRVDHVHLSYGDTPVAHYLRQMTDDLLVHGWDLAAAIGADDALDPDLVQAALDRADPAALASSGLFGPAVEVPADADPQTRLLALYGRRR